ncbi:MAG: hypothetical protein L6Q73_17560 [Aquabacterium sp.]|jgi:hypothetical protein|nr:hypothetical protein [Aquabacterium sp.]
MLNALETYAECGRRAARALNQGDGCRYSFEHNWFRRAIGLETASDRPQANKAYESGFAAARNAPQPEPFR